MVWKDFEIQQQNFDKLDVFLLKYCVQKCRLCWGPKYDRMLSKRFPFHCIRNVSTVDLKKCVSPTEDFKDGEGENVSISPIFYEWLFCMKVTCDAILCLHFKFELFFTHEYLLIKCWWNWPQNEEVKHVVRL